MRQNQGLLSPSTYCTPVDDQPQDLARPLVPEPAGVHQVALLGDDHVRGPGPALHHTPELPRTQYYLKKIFKHSPLTWRSMAAVLLTASPSLSVSPFQMPLSITES